MSETNIQCPHCNNTIPLTKTLELQLKQQIENDIKKNNLKLQKEIQEQQEILEKQKEDIITQKNNLDKTIKNQLQKEKESMWEKAQTEAEKKIKLNLLDLKNQNQEIKNKLQNAEKNELELRKKARELEDEKNKLNIIMQRKLDEERNNIIKKAKTEADESHRLRILEKDKQMEILKKTIEDLKRKSEQGSMQIQGEVLENDLKNILQNNFPMDKTEDVPQGIKGADLIQTIEGNIGLNKGIILYESKNTKTWSNDWIKKLKQDQTIVKADICILISRVLPEGVNEFTSIDGIWITSYNTIIPLIKTLRIHLLELSKVKSSLVGREEKMDYLYNYLTGKQFQNRVENIINGFINLKNNLETEKRSLQRIWSKREKTLSLAMENTSGFYGDLQAIIGASLATVKNLELPLEDDDEPHSNEINQDVI